MHDQCYVTNLCSSLSDGAVNDKASDFETTPNNREIDPTSFKNLLCACTNGHIGSHMTFQSLILEAEF